MVSTRQALISLAITSILLAGCGSSDNASKIDALATSTTSTTPTTAASSTVTTAAPTSTSTASKHLTNGEYLGTFSNVEPTLKLANFTVTCPKSDAGTYLVNLVQATFDVESNPTHPESGSVNSMTFEQWAPIQADQEWIVRQSDAIVSVRSATAPSDHTIC
jgi:hypothetical protein